MKKLILAAGVLLGVLVLSTFRPAPLPEPPPLREPLPRAEPPAEMAILQIPTGIAPRRAGTAYRGGSLWDERECVMTATLVKHPKGDLLIDTGFGRHVKEQVRAAPSLAFRVRMLVTSYEPGCSAADQLDGAGYDRARLRAIVLTHAHWDHVSGIPDFPGTPVWLPSEERRFIEEGGPVTSLARGLSGVRYEEYSFDGGAYLGFPKSHDVYGDGSIVIVPAPGHTPGSVIVFLTLPSAKRFALIGDLVWQREGLTEREEKPWISRYVDHDPLLLRESLLRMIAIAKGFPEITMVPAHDARGFAAIPLLSASHEKAP
jgi:glyoxylase-like metal-dependent hydrolase (beta-lactamase superfamily II)